MTNYAYIESLFKTILMTSKAIKGNFFIGWRYGLQDINYDNFGKEMDAVPADSKWPAAIMAPPHSQQKFAGKEEGWELFRIIMFFMNRSQYQDVDQFSKTAQHSIVNDWEDMKRCSINFMRALKSAEQVTNGLIFRLPTHEALTIPLSMVGADKVSGVRIDFDFKVYVGCSIEDYNEYPTEITIPIDGHEEHDL